MSETQLQALSIEDGEKEEIKIAGDDPRGIWQHLRHYLKVAVKTFDLDSPWGYGAFLTAYMIVIFVHPLHYYAYVINSQHNCLEINNELYATFAVVAFFNTYMLLYVPNEIGKIFLGTIRKEKGIEHFMFTQVPVLLMTLTILPDLTRGTTDKIFVTTTNLFLFGYMLLVIGLSITIRNASKQTGFIARAKWAKAVFNLFLYLHGGHVFGAIWYCFAIDRILVCWRDEYISKNTLKYSTFVCGNHNLEKLSCHKTANITDFGIFNDALEYRIVEMKPFLKKYLFCLRWGLQVLSCFGQNLQPSTFPLENIYVISVIIYSTLLFVFLIGNMQTYLQSASERPEDIVNNIKMEERLGRLKKVKELGKWQESRLKVLCNRMKPAFYGDRTLVIREGEPISEILFVLQGKLWTYTSSRADTDDSSNGKNVLMGEGDIIGEELVSWIQAQPHSSTLPISTRTIQTLKHVEAVAITAYDLKDVFIKKLEPEAIGTRSLLKKCTGWFHSRFRKKL
ncbi:cyclic nucleotide-gated ion channel 1-like isoform X2 [Mangifera indica]|uniref:cyclic nucleotide-gated ion channel 1-like isoform X2 n=1 Tax=Mangifera indica TaxID=29780 RepID=UPI001CFB8CE8|nr:cyclic nucleotide-gated ion channel 1-like isoform X2 [Mangifera indica]